MVFCVILQGVMLLVSLALTPLFLLLQQDAMQVECGGGPPKPVQTDERGVMRCENGAVVTFQNVRVESDWMEYEIETRQLTAGDSVHFQRGLEDLRGGRLSLNTETKSGTLTGANGQLLSLIHISEPTRLL